MSALVLVLVLVASTLRACPSAELTSCGAPLADEAPGEAEAEAACARVSAEVREVGESIVAGLSSRLSSLVVAEVSLVLPAACLALRLRGWGVVGTWRVVVLVSMRGGRGSEE